MKKIVVILTIINSFFVSGLLKAQNPRSICITCGNFDLAKINFNEDLNELGTKTKILTKASVQSYADQTKTYETLFLFKNEQNSDVEIITYENWFKFNNVNILSNVDKKIISYNAFNFYDGPLKKINVLFLNLRISLKTTH